MAVCLERIWSFDARTQMATIDSIVWRGAISIAAIEVRSDVLLRGLPRTLREDEADRTLTALTREIEDPTPLRSIEGQCSSGKARFRSSGLQAAALIAAAGECACCQRNFAQLIEGVGWAALEVHHLHHFSGVPETVDTGLGDVVVVCGACHNMLHVATPPSILDLTYAWRPRCPECDAKRARRVMYGEPIHLPRPGDVVGGCLVEPGEYESWDCASCGHQWRTSSLEA